MPKKQIILTQAALASSRDKKTPLLNGNSSFFQHRYIFVYEAEMAEFNNLFFWLLVALNDISIPTFSDVNLPYHYEKNS
ncbi:MAG: hypothetical protein F6K25_25175 [Okeania sp. SIO2G4]|uniref:hypothetical protein n=1 Tax=unclassified Okeania TaxID=2634635 RepID=UPI0013BA4ED1|nr:MULTISPECIES: hypothetical protein [unclassified Okeania]NEP38258.1 hypothetical protein [Okeania sp. SIO2H7]NEP74952.1 hypothetical protein [Okeania sp. SIO2G5]NEP92828.1 hypothetical protein [Okeania sp. SIO2F5]NEQ93767.1 hypothetical protein [Okeania sp. SIO2G4]